jgi:hypothetical protein
MTLLTYGGSSVDIFRSRIKSHRVLFFVNEPGVAHIADVEWTGHVMAAPPAALLFLVSHKTGADTTAADGAPACSLPETKQSKSMPSVLSVVMFRTAFFRHFVCGLLQATVSNTSKNLSFLW